jgi:hypothetical protein
VAREEVKEENDDEVLNPLDMEMDDEELLVGPYSLTELKTARRTARRARRRTHHIR